MASCPITARANSGGPCGSEDASAAVLARGPRGARGPEGPAGPAGPPGQVVIRRFQFPEPSLEWRVDHGAGTDAFLHVLRDEDGNLMFAPVRIVDANTFVVTLSSATSGHVDALFGSL